MHVSNPKLFKVASDGSVSVHSAAVCESTDQSCFDLSNGLAVDDGGNVFVAAGKVIRKIAVDGTATTVAVNSDEGGFADGTGPAARFTKAQHMTFGPSGELFVADGSVVRRITPDGAVTTVVGVPGQMGVRPGPLPTTLNIVNGIAATPEGNLVLLSEGAVLDVVF